jgi:hypothetical protein
MVAQANGHWVQIAPSVIAQVNDNEDIPNPTVFDYGGSPQPAVFDYYLPANVAPRLLVSARECDIPAIDCVHDWYGSHAAKTPFSEVGYNDHPGRILAGDAPYRGEHVGRLLSLGTQTLQPGYNPNHTADEDLSDYTCGDGIAGACYTVTATLSIL